MHNDNSVGSSQIAIIATRTTSTLAAPSQTRYQSSSSVEAALEKIEDEDSEEPEEPSKP